LTRLIKCADEISSDTTVNKIPLFLPLGLFTFTSQIFTLRINTTVVLLLQIFHDILLTLDLRLCELHETKISNNMCAHNAIQLTHHIKYINFYCTASRCLYHTKDHLA